MPRLAWIAALLIALGAAGALRIQSHAHVVPACDVCERPVCKGASYTIHMSWGRTRHACCPRCGIRYEKEHPGAERDATVQDFATGTAVRARDAVYVEGSDFSHCRPSLLARDQSGACYRMCYDRCFPSIVAFAERKAALDFKKVHGGNLRSFGDLLRE